MKTGTERNQNFAAPNDEELISVTGGIRGEGSADGGTVDYYMNILAMMNLHPPRDEVAAMIAAGGSCLRNWALNASHGNGMANLIPIFD